MTKQICLPASLILLILIIAAAGCVTPPKGTSSSSTSGGYYSTETGTPETTGTPQYVTVVTPYSVGTQENSTSASGANPYVTPTPPLEDRSCLIYFNTQNYAFNTTAITFDLKNPPMYINYTVVPTNVTVNKWIQERSGSKNEVTYTYSDYAPYSWFEVTVRNKTSGEVYLQDGFGESKGYTRYLNATLKVLKRDDMLIEFKGNSIKATVGVWVKPIGNFDDPENKTFAECKFWTSTQNTLPYATATTTPTWTPENQKNERPTN